MHFWLGSDAENQADHAAAADARANRMVITHEASDLAERMVISLHGSFDIDHAAEVWTLLHRSVEQYRCVLLDVSEVPQMDSSGLASVAEAHRLARQNQTIFGLVGVNPQVMKMLKMSGLQRAIRLYRSVPEALTSLASSDFACDCPARSFSESLARGGGSFSGKNFQIDPLSPEPRRVA